MGIRRILKGSKDMKRSSTRILWCCGLGRKQAGEIKCSERLPNISERASTDHNGGHCSRQTDSPERTSDPCFLTYSVWSTILGNTTSLEDIRKPFGNFSAFPAHNSLRIWLSQNMHAHALEILFSLIGLFRPPKIHLRTSGLMGLRVRSGLAAISQWFLHYGSLVHTQSSPLVPLKCPRSPDRQESPLEY